MSIGNYEFSVNNQERSNFFIQGNLILVCIAVDNGGKWCRFSEKRAIDNSPYRRGRGIVQKFKAAGASPQPYKRKRKIVRNWKAGAQCAPRHAGFEKYSFFCRGHSRMTRQILQNFETGDLWIAPTDKDINCANTVRKIEKTSALSTQLQILTVLPRI